jgi:hypothetical protein
MAGIYGSTLLSELNRLANGGTYPAISEFVDMALATKRWAEAKDITPTKTDTVGILNEIAGIVDQKDYLDFNGVCNLLADTTGLPAAAALRGIES